MSGHSFGCHSFPQHARPEPWPVGTRVHSLGQPQREADPGARSCGQAVSRAEYLSTQRGSAFPLPASAVETLL